jgi:uncharacterized membrane protein YczE
MTAQNQLKFIENQIRLRSLRGWAIVLAIFFGVTTLEIAGFGVSELINPKVWTSTFSIMAHAGFLRQFVLPLSSISIIFVVVALVSHLFIDKTIKLND